VTSAIWRRYLSHYLLLRANKDARAKIFLIVDNLRVHHSKPVKARLADRIALIEVFYLPSYAPELNPEESLNVDFKHAIGAAVAVRAKAKVKSAAEAHMTTIEKSNHRVYAALKLHRAGSLNAPRPSFAPPWRRPAKAPRAG
jgi:hypothetical protein